MKPLCPPDTHHLSAAEGWLELGDPDEALAELEKITPSMCGHIHVLSLRWLVFARLKQWTVCVEIGNSMVAAAPKLQFGWIQRSFALHELKKTKEARDLLLPVVEKFPKDTTIPYNLACYECQLGDLKAARRWLEKTLAMKGAKMIKRQALEDPDLAPLRDEIAQLQTE